MSKVDQKLQQRAKQSRKEGKDVTTATATEPKAKSSTVKPKVLNELAERARAKQAAEDKAAKSDAAVRFAPDASDLTVTPPPAEPPAEAQAEPVAVEEAEPAPEKVPYWKTDKGKAAAKRYRESAKGKATAAARRASPEHEPYSYYKAHPDRAKAIAKRYRERKKAEREAELARMASASPPPEQPEPKAKRERRPDKKAAQPTKTVAGTS
jgi:hypothetical protein